MKKILREIKFRTQKTFTVVSFLQYLSLHYYIPTKNGDIINCGAPRSGSTLLNIIIKKILVYGLKKEENYVPSNKEYISKINNQQHYNLVKTHKYIPLVKKRINQQKSIGFFTHRDIRDIIVSLIQKGWIENFNEFIDQKNLHSIVYSSIAYAKSNHIIIFSYEDLINRKEKVIKTVSKALAIPLTPDEVQKIIVETSPETVNNTIENISMTNEGESEYNPSTGLHKNHIADGRMGKWKEILTTEQIEIINKIAADYNNLFNYN